MKRICILFAMVLCISTGAMAQSVAGKVVFEGFGTIGASYPDYAGGIDSSYESQFDVAYSLGITGGFGVMDSLLVFGGLEYAVKPLKTQSDSLDFTFEPTYKSLDIVAGIRYLYSGLYGDLGFYYGMPMGDVKFEGTNSGTVDKDSVKNDYGILLGAGYIIQINEQVGIDLGLRVKYGFATIIDDPNNYNVKVSTYDLKIGATYSL